LAEVTGRNSRDNAMALFAPRIGTYRQKGQEANK
jgi:hypothetical protein